MDNNHGLCGEHQELVNRVKAISLTRAECYLLWNEIETCAACERLTPLHFVYPHDFVSVSSS